MLFTVARGIPNPHHYTIMEYSLLQIIRHRLNLGNTIVHLQADLDTVRRPSSISPLRVRPMNTRDRGEIAAWVDLVNDAYREDPPYDLHTARRHIANHLFLDIASIYLVTDADAYVATISIGTYKLNPRVGGQARIAVRRRYQGQGLGQFVICYGCEQLRNMGLALCENIVAVKRRRSIMLHLYCGFDPQYRRAYQQDVPQKRFFAVKALAAWTLIKYHRRHKARFYSRFSLTE